MTAMGRYGNHKSAPRYPHPFVNEVQLSSAQKIRGVLLGAVLFPTRLALAALFFLLMWPFAKLRLAGLSAKQRAEPVQGWRRWLLHPIILLLSRAVFFSLGFFWIRIKGRRADPREAPMLAVAPHSSFLDILILCPAALPTVVSRSENSSLPIIGALLEFNQSLVVSRKDPESRRRCAAQLKERLTSNGRWPQMLLFPEGTTTNGQALIKFKLGAFMAGVPVQPVLLSYPNKLNTVCWTWKGTDWMEVVWHTASQLYTNITVEYLPVYTPSQEEKANPTLYAANVQKLMAEKLGIPATDYVLEGKIPVQRMGCLSLPVEAPGRETLTLLQRAGLSTSSVESALRRMMDRCQSGRESCVGVEELGSLLQLKDKRRAVDIFGLYSKEGRMDLRQLCLSVAAVSGLWSLESLIQIAFTLFDGERKGSLTSGEFKELLVALVGFSQNNTEELYSGISSRGQPTQEDLRTLLTDHPTYQKLFREYLKPVDVSGHGVLGNGIKELVINGSATSHKKDD
uniref:Lysophosphatidylcholine acyltransferase 4 n=1 Tax=Paramormyrops kingsleyae TaxID=1676925 RepID=A0A3B3SJY5_9TELE|nr:lysophospholipid acyltransferase LPCAT4 [Paramormyrops kingsleyae]